MGLSFSIEPLIENLKSNESLTSKQLFIFLIIFLIILASVLKKFIQLFCIIIEMSHLNIDDIRHRHHNYEINQQQQQQNSNIHHHQQLNRKMNRQFVLFSNIIFVILLGVSVTYLFYNRDNFYLKSFTRKMSLIQENSYMNLPKAISQLQEELKNNPLDPNSFSRADQAKIEHLHLNLKIDFNNHVLDGNVKLSVKKIVPNIQHLYLDTLNLTILNIYQIVNDSKRVIPFKLYPPVPEFGSKLEINIDEINMEKFDIYIGYRTHSTSRALMWMKPEQTQDKRHPFMYSQCQAINARALLPCQDTPSVKQTYSAEIRASKDIQVLMSAKIVKDPVPTDDGLYRTHYFDQHVPIPSYLIAIVAGDLVSKKIGRISHVWAEPGTIESAAWEFAEIDKLLETAEHFAGDYVWGIYDILVLPPSFPYGGMENPCLTFATPTLLAGDRSLVYVIAHEISHSWTGNLVTNANYGHFWLNEGFTTFLERKIGGRLNEHGEKFRQFTALEGLDDLKSTVQYYGDTSPYTKLLIDIRGVNPDDVFSTVPYEKGHTFLFYLEQKLGGPEIFEPFLKAYINKFKYQSIITDDFRRYLYEYFKTIDSKKIETLDSIDWDRWLHSPGMPPVIPDYDKTLLMSSVNLATKWLKINDIKKIDLQKFPKSEFDSLQTIQKKLFFIQLRNRLNESTILSMSEKLSKMFELYNIDTINNCEVKNSWIMLGIQAKYENIISEAIDFVTKYGRMKYIVAIYRSLYQWDKTRQLSLDTFEKNRSHYMRVAIDAIEKDLHPNKIDKTNQL